MSFALAGNARAALDRYMARQAQLNHVSVGALEKRFTVDPAVQQRLENTQMLSSGLLQKINVIGVKEQEGEKVLIGTTGPIARTNSTSDGTQRRNPATVHDLEARRYRCDQVNYDTAIGYPQLDAWAGHADFPLRISQQIARQVALDRIMIGFNGTSHALISDFAKNPLLQDILPGWLAQIRQKAPQRVMSDVTISTRDMTNKVVGEGKYSNPDALVQDARSSLLDEWHKEAPDLVVLIGRDLLNSLRLPYINTLSATSPNVELLAGQLILSSEMIGGLPVYVAPFFPKDAMLITAFSNLSIYYLLGGLRRLMREEPEYNRLAVYQSSVDGYVVEDLGKVALIDKLTFAKPKPQKPATDTQKKGQTGQDGV